MPDGLRAGNRPEPLESRMPRKWPVLFGEGPTEKGWLTSTSPAAYSTLRGGANGNVGPLPDAHKCRDLARAIAPQRWTRARLLRRLLRALWRGEVARAQRVLRRQRPQAADPQAVDTLQTYLEARAEWIPDYRARRRYIGNGLGEKANDRIVARRQKRRGMRWSVQTSDALAALRTLLLNEGWETYWQYRCCLPLTRVAA